MNQNNLQLNQLTKNSLKEALLHLLRSTKIEDITVTMLTNKAGVSRMAYYRNYPSISELYHEICDDYFSNFFQNNLHFALANQQKAFYESVFQFIQDHREVAKILLSSKGNFHFLNYLNKIFVDSQVDLNSRYYFRGFIGFFFNVLLEWIERDFDLSPEALAEISLMQPSHSPEELIEKIPVKKYMDQKQP